jgi:hypothetical protein
MPPASKRKSAGEAGRVAHPKPAAQEKPFLRFHHSEALRKKTLAVLAELEAADDATACREALAELVVELTCDGMDAFYLVPLKHARTGFIVEQSAKLGMAGVQQVMGSVIRNVIGHMDPVQLLSVGASIRGFMR